MSKEETLDLSLFDKKNREDAEEYIISRIRELVHRGELEPGTRLPSERALADSLQTSRGNVRKALQRLEFYGLVNITPQSGTRIASLHQETVEELIDSIPVSRNRKMADLMEARFILDVQCARLAAERRNEADLALIQRRQEGFLKAFYSSSESFLEEDYLFHLAIAHATGNHILVSLFSQLTPPIVTSNQPHLGQRDRDFSRIPSEHQTIIDAIRSGNPDEAEEAMTGHRNWALKRIFEGEGK